MAINNISPKKGKVVDIPDAPTIGTATAGGESATVAFTAATKGGPAITYTALSSPGSITGTGSSSPITVSGLTAGTSYTFTVRGSNATGNGEYSSASNSITALDGNSFDSISTQTIGAGGASSVTFSSIPSTYKHLQIRWIARTTRASTDGDWIGMRFNGDTSASSYYGQHYLLGDGSVNGLADGNAAQIYIERAASANTTANVFGAGVVDILDYSNSNKNKVTRNLAGIDNNSGTTTSNVRLATGLWMSTSGITSISLFAGTGPNFAQYSQFALYGIKG